MATKLGEVMRLLRERYQYTQAEIARRADVSISLIQKLETADDEVGVRASTLRKIAYAFQISPERLLAIQAVYEEGIDPFSNHGRLEVYLEAHRGRGYRTDVVERLAMSTQIVPQKIEKYRKHTGGLTDGEWTAIRKIIVMDEINAMVDDPVLAAASRKGAAPLPVYDTDLSRQSPADRAEGIPILSSVPASGFLDFSVDPESDEFLPRSLYDVPQARPAALRVVGDSMVPALMPGDTIIVATQGYEPQTDDLLVVGMKQESGHTVKRLRVLSATEWELVPNNPAYSPLRVNVSDVSYTALVVAFVRRLPIRPLGFGKTK